MTSSRLQRKADAELERIAVSPLRGAWTAAALVTVVVTIVAGSLMRLTDPKTFPNIGLGFWWAIQTVTTVGYGDVVPASILGRTVAALVMVVGLGFITVSTAAIASAFVEAAQRRRAEDADSSLLVEVRQLRREMQALAEEVRVARRPGGDDRSD